jgi:hypothetical protein
MGVAPEVPQHGRHPTEGGLRVDDPVRLEERVDEGVPPGGVLRVLGAGQIELAPPVGSPNIATNFPRNTRLYSMPEYVWARTLLIVSARGSAALRTTVIIDSVVSRAPLFLTKRLSECLRGYDRNPANIGAHIQYCSGPTGFKTHG